MTILPPILVITWRDLITTIGLAAIYLFAVLLIEVADTVYQAWRDARREAHR